MSNDSDMDFIRDDFFYGDTYSPFGIPLTPETRERTGLNPSAEPHDPGFFVPLNESYEQSESLTNLSDENPENEDSYILRVLMNKDKIQNLGDIDECEDGILNIRLLLLRNGQSSLWDIQVQTLSIAFRNVWERMFGSDETKRSHVKALLLQSRNGNVYALPEKKLSIGSRKPERLRIPYRCIEKYRIMVSNKAGRGGEKLKKLLASREMEDFNFKMEYGMEGVGLYEVKLVDGDYEFKVDIPAHDSESTNTYPLIAFRSQNAWNYLGMRLRGAPDSSFVGIYSLLEDLFDFEDSILWVKILIIFGAMLCRV